MVTFKVLKQLQIGFQGPIWLRFEMKTELRRIHSLVAIFFIEKNVLKQYISKIHLGL